MKTKEEIESITLKAIRKEDNKIFDVVEADWFCNSGCTEKRPSWIKVSRVINDEEGEYCRTEEFEASSDDFNLFIASFKEGCAK